LKEIEYKSAGSGTITVTVMGNTLRAVFRANLYDPRNILISQIAFRSGKGMIRMAIPEPEPEPEPEPDDELLDVIFDIPRQYALVRVNPL
jgi:hypothetical protein